MNHSTKRVYMVFFNIQRNNQIQNWVYCCEATNAKEASEIAKQTWTSKSHMFHVHAVRSRMSIDAVSFTGWTGKQIKGRNAMGKHILLDFYTWRVNGKSVFC